MSGLLSSAILLVSLAACAACQARAQPMPDFIDGRAFYLPLVMREAVARDLPPEIADAVAMVETGYRPDAVGSSGEIGLMQVMPATAAQLGFRGTLADLADPATNIRLGVAYLARAWAAAGGDICRTLAKYRAGLGEQVITPRSAQYCGRATAWLMGRGSALDQTTMASNIPALPLGQTGDPYVVVMPQVRPMPPLPEGVRLTPVLAMEHIAVRHPTAGFASRRHRASLDRRNAAETSTEPDD